MKSNNNSNRKAYSKRSVKTYSEITHWKASVSVVFVNWVKWVISDSVSLVKKVTPLLWTLAAVLLFLWIAYDDGYSVFHKEKTVYRDQVEQIENTTERDQELDELSKVELFMTPDLKLMDKIVEMVDKAEERVWIQVYIFTERDIRSALVRAQKRWVDVRVLLEPHVFGAPDINKTTYDMLENSDVDVSYASDDLYTFTHSKFLLIDDVYVIGTWNISYSTFRHNRDFFAMWDDPEVLQSLEKLYNQDFNHAPHAVVSQDLIVSPDWSREEILWLLDDTESELIMYAQSLSDDEIKSKLKQLYDRWVSISLYMWHIDKYPANEDDIAELRVHWLTIVTPKTPYIHAKALFIDETVWYIGSINFTQNSLDNNREVGIIFDIETSSLPF